MSMCNNGECLDELDWKCGFEIDLFDVQFPDNQIKIDRGSTDQLHDCFNDVADIAKPWVKLDKIRKFCGKKFARFTGNNYSPGECKKAGGTWGKITPAQPVEH